jgi:quercetin dioxygenase-like cupin family protein
MRSRKFVKYFNFLVISAITSVAYGASENEKAVQIKVDEIKWTAVPAVPGEKISWLTGSQDKAGPYALRAHLVKGATIPPHTHPDRRCVTVLSGNLYIAEGKTVDIDKTNKFPAGSFFCVEAGVPHYVSARDGDAEFQDSGVAPTATVWLNK